MTQLEALQKKFINLRFGTFIHFNSATFQFHNNPDIIDWEYDHENGDLPRQFPFDEKDFNPTAPDYCKQWAKIAKSAGCQFAALTSKHHEGFDLWPSDYTDHCVKNATNKTDVVAAYLDAFRSEGIVAGLYFSVLDLTAQTGHRSCTTAQKEKIFGQVTELLTNYGEIPFLIVDGWNAPWGGPSYEMLPFEELDRLVKSLQPDCMLMNIAVRTDCPVPTLYFMKTPPVRKSTIASTVPAQLQQTDKDMVLERRRSDNARYKRRMGTFQNEGLFPPECQLHVKSLPFHNRSGGRKSCAGICQDR